MAVSNTPVPDFRSKRVPIQQVTKQNVSKSVASCPFTEANISVIAVSYIVCDSVNPLGAGR